MGANARRATVKKRKSPALPSRDTWPVPPPESAEVAIGHDTIPTPPPHPNEVEELEIPSIPGLDVERILKGADSA